ncbi:uncharacterized protein FFB20_02352 [Fusarium fujikuroi]|nr:Uncharacterized protein Y057_13281 [Fusarium fujikuroi]SCN66831.1 uncharacterized protein FFB20_02352 [Fusarium fujikuroi]SCN81842.1 uncharacterized protein FFE2_04814 [Fusarium fujikuroi]SCN85084.1 uncharacterized protein FFC1_04777 [Fusarium fujikuroi]SCO34251.1 uncharacterized protein FFNC_03722 [Fusarium fujikuroi]
MAGGARSKSGVASLKSADLSQTFDAPPSSIDANNSKKTMTSSPSRNSSRVTNDEDETRQKGGTLLLQLGRSAPLDKRHRDVGDEDFDDEASAASMKRGKYMSIKGEPEIDDGSERQPSLYRQQSLQVLQDSRVPPGVPAVERYSTENTGIVDPRYDFMCGNPRASGGYLSDKFPRPTDFTLQSALTQPLSFKRYLLAEPRTRS